MDLLPINNCMLMLIQVFPPKISDSFLPCVQTVHECNKGKGIVLTSFPRVLFES